MNHPNRVQRDRDALDDVGLVDDADRTEDLRPLKRNAPGRCANTAEGLQNNPPTKEQEFQQ
ncbi:hypothetical protein VT930_09580 [Mycobacterium sherrisii]|uniref:hypothetical protein n=1 Tax=Mycobacterium sherrisii TaxID=243061 RepID=UPI002DDCCDA4|nr:hypothetical protein [Mycobacterium sherrisii]MEC4763354.1 hypothetical protein [Mycobacterium sherrisii]